MKLRGSAYCGTWVKERAVDKSWLTIVNEGWLIGYLSGLAAGKDKDILKGTDNDSIFLWMDNYCKERLLERVDNGVIELFFELINKKGL